MRRFSAIRVFVAAFAVLAAGFTTASAAKPEIYTKRLSDLAVDGYDVVAYFNEGEPVKGNAAFEREHKGAIWRFSSQANLDAFSSNPAAYAPQYGGYCAWAAAQGYTARGNPKNWTVHEGKLYLNYSTGVQRKWEKDIPGFIAKADVNWPGILN
ncbi:MAG: YHS domain-containing (seleno)protein [Pseudomonadota bacterium]